MFDLVVNKQIVSTLKYDRVDTQEPNLEFQDWIHYNELDFGNLSLGEVVSLLECLQKEESDISSDSCSSILLTKIKNQRMIARWNNVIAASHIKFFIQTTKKVAKYACQLES